MVKRRTRDREVPGSIPTNSKCCFLEQETLSTLLSTGFYPGKKRATWKISTRLLNGLPSMNKVDYYYFIIIIIRKGVYSISIEVYSITKGGNYTQRGLLPTQSGLLYKKRDLLYTERGILYKERICSQREQILSLQSRPFSERVWCPGKQNRKSQTLSPLSKRRKIYRVHPVSLNAMKTLIRLRICAV